MEVEVLWSLDCFCYVGHHPLTFLVHCHCLQNAPTHYPHPPTAVFASPSVEVGAPLEWETTTNSITTRTTLRPQPRSAIAATQTEDSNTETSSDGTVIRKRIRPF